ncbi:MAG TPA: hypothetical protein VKB58_03530 [Terriglobales bacterium]|nr:hypothetical protein [Terriglobales bacterium]
MNAELPSARDSRSQSFEGYERQKSREPIKLVGLLVIALFLLLIGFPRFGKTIPWGAR